MRMTRLLSSKGTRRIVGATTAFASCCIAASTFVTSHQATVECKEQKKKMKHGNLKGYIEANLMDKIASKPYLQPLNGRSFSRKNVAERPKGVPNDLRVLVIDVPEFRHVFDEKCTVDLAHVFPDGIAPPKTVTIPHAGELDEGRYKNGNGGQSTTIEVLQKSFARSIARCGAGKKVILLEASIDDLVSESEEEAKKTMKRGSKKDESKNNRFNLSKEIKKVKQEYNNQYAWLEELRLRINGRVPFGSVLERASTFSMFFFGNVYHWKSWINLQFWKKSSDYNKYVNDMKPHAVIADGRSLHKVPGAMQELVAVCKSNDVPLWVINDPRVWVSNVDDLESAALSMRKEVRTRIIINALDALQSQTFERGRQIGKAEADAKNAAVNAAKSAIRLSQKLRRDSWKNLTKQELQNELIRRGVCQVSKDSTNQMNALTCQEAFRDICLIVGKDISTKQMNETEATNNANRSNSFA